MTGPIVCGIDFSEHSRRALAWARLLSAKLHLPLIVVHAVEPVLAEAARVTYGPDALAESIAPELEEFVQPDAETTIEVGAGEPAGVIHGVALARDASLIVIGTQGLGPAQRLWFGSTTQGLLRETTIPILGVPPRATDSVTIAEFIVGTDFSEVSTAALTAALALAERYDAPVTCLHVVKTAAAHLRWNDVIAKATDAAVQDARARMGKLSTSVSAAVPFTAEVTTGDAADVLIHVAEGRDVIIVVGLGGADPKQRPGTTAYRVLAGADAPVLAVPK